MSIYDDMCFVVMGFGKKTDPILGRVLDLDKTYEHIIKPAIEKAGLNPVRADEVLHSQVIDKVMYEMLYHSRLVIADISASNVNAIYELGVRHALRPYSTIVMREDKGDNGFDLNHINTFMYEHMGADIGATEAKLKSEALAEMISTVLDGSKTDSPVYSFLPLNKPIIDESKIEKIIEQVEEQQEFASDLRDLGEKQICDSDFEKAKITFEKLIEKFPNESMYYQRLALATYKNDSTVSGYVDALSVINKLNPDVSNDPETLGIHGAINKNLFLKTNDIKFIDKAIRSYDRGLAISKDYYNGENLIECHLIKAENSEGDEKTYNVVAAKKIAIEVNIILNEILQSENFLERSDVKWVYASKAYISRCIGNEDEALNAEKTFYSLGPSQWEAETFETTKARSLERSKLTTNASV